MHGIIKRGAKLKNSAGITYETLEDIDFSSVDISNSNYCTVSNADPSTKQPTAFALRVNGCKIKAGETTTTTFTVGSYEPFRKLTIVDDDIIEVIEVKDSNNNLWYEVDYLAQDTVFDGVKNSGADSNDVPYILKLKSVPRRFITEYDIDSDRMSIIFGSGDADAFDGELIPNIGDLALPLYGKDTFCDFSIDPQNFLKTRTLGLCPSNTTLTVKYRFGGGTDSNSGAEEISEVTQSIFEVADSSLDSSIIRDVGNSFSVVNPKPVVGGKDSLTIEEIRQLISANFATQSRMVTAEDFIVRSLTMPTRYGSVFRSNVNVNPLNRNAVELVVLAKDNNGYVTVASNDLKDNLKKYLNRFRMLTQGIEILDGKIINIEVRFGILTDSDMVKTEVLSNCIEVMREYFDVDKWQLGQPLNKTIISKVISDVKGVISVTRLDFINRIGTFDGRNYSTDNYNIVANTRNNIVYLDANSIFEVKYTSKDIKGFAK